MPIIKQPRPIDLKWCFSHALRDECPPDSIFYQCCKDAAEDLETETCAQCWEKFAEHATTKEPVYYEALVLVKGADPK